MSLNEVLDKLQSERALAVFYRATTALSGLLSKAAVARVGVEQIVEALNAEKCAVLELSEDALDYVLLHSVGMPDEVVEAYRRFPVEAALPTRDVLLTKEPIFIEGPDEWNRRYEPLPVASGSLAVLPLLSEAEMIGAITIALPPGRTFSSSDRNFLMALATLCAQAFERDRLYEAERDARRRAEEANQAKSQFLNMMSHELRTPLNAVLGYAELLLMQVRGPLTEAQQAQVEGIRTSATHQLTLIEDILDYASIDAGRIEIRLEPANLASIATTAVNLLRQQAEAKGIEIRITIADGASFILNTDAARVRQIILNLVSNAVKFTSEGAVEVIVDAEAEWFKVRVRDTGPGIPADALASIWQPFVQLHTEASSPYVKGTGLGLPIALNLAQMLGGELTATSRIGQGSTFELSLPRLHP